MLAPSLSAQVRGGNASALYRINVLGSSQATMLGGLAPIFEGFFPIAFSFGSGYADDVNGELIIEGPGQATRDGGTISLTVPSHDTSLQGPQLIDGSIHFADDPAVPFPFRGRTIRSKIPAQLGKLSPCDGERVLATSEEKPVWSVAEEAGASHYRSAFALPVVGPEGGLKDVFNEERFLELVPLIHWLRSVCSGTDYQRPKPRACFIFDDPNLHWPHYGFVNYDEIAAHAARKNYHVSFATIPLDTWFTHRRTAEIFRNNPDRLSLCVHGNDHISKELAQDYTEAERANLLRQAIRRIERLERKAGVPVSRVMVPPHGACLEAMLGDLPKSGFEAACISHGSLRAHNSNKSWTKMLGYLPSELIQGCPVLPRWGLAGNVTNTILLAAFLQQAIVLRGHHQDLKDGVEVLDKLANEINGLGPVLWSNLTELCRANYSWRQVGELFQVKPWGRKLNVCVPEGILKLAIEAPAGHVSKSWRIQSEGSVDQLVDSGEVALLSGRSNISISIEANHVMTRLEQNIPDRLKPKVLVRRFLTEARDRLHLNSVKY